MKFFSISVFILFILGCSDTTIQVQSVDKENYAKKNKVAVLAVDFSTNSIESDSFSDGFSKFLQATNAVSDAEKERGIKSNDDRYNAVLKKAENDSKEYLNTLEDRLITKMNMYFLSKKFTPLERSEIVKILKETSLYQTGLFNNTKNIQIGKLATADLIMLSRVDVRVKGAYSRKYEVLLTCKLISVEDGGILAIGEVSVVGEELNEALLNRAIEKWFSGIPDDKWHDVIKRVYPGVMTLY